MSDEELQEQLRQHQLQQKSPVPPPPTSFLPVKDVSISSYTAPNINTNISTASDLSPLVIPQASNVSASDINDGERTYLQTLSRSGSATASDYDGDYGKLKPDWTNRNQSSSSFTGADLTLKSFNDKSVYRDLDLDESRELISPLKTPILASRKSSFPDHSHRQDGPDNDRHESFKGSRGVGFNDTVTSSQEWARASSKRIELPSPKLVYSSSVEKGEPSQSQFQSQAPSPISQLHSGAQRSPVTKPYTAAQLLKAQEGIKVAESTSGKEGGPGSWKHAKSVVVQRPSYYNINIDQLDRSEGRTSFSNSDTDKSDTRHPIDGDTGVADSHKSNKGQGQGLGLGHVRRGSTVSLLESRSGDGRGGLDSSVEVKMKWGDMQPDLSPVQVSEASRIGPLSVEKTVPSTPSSSVFVPEMFTPVGREQDQSMVEAMVDRSMGDSDNAAATHPGRLSPMIVIVQKRPSTIISSGKSKPVNYGRRDSSTNTPKRSSAHKNASLRGSPNGLPVGHTKQKDSSSGEGSFMRRNYGEQEEEQEEEEVADSGSDLGSRSLRSCSESSSSMDNSSLSHRLLEHQVSRKTDSPAKVEYSPKKRAVRGSKADWSTRSHSEKDRERERDRGRERESDNSSTKDLKDQITVLREKVLLLEAESKLHQDEREDRLTEFKSSEDLWTVQLSALTKRNISLDEENKQLKGLTQSNRIQSTMREAKMSVLEGELN